MLYNYIKCTIFLGCFCLCSLGSNADTALLKSMINSMTGLPSNWNNSLTYCQTYTGVGCVVVDDEYYLHSINLTNFSLGGRLPQRGWKNASKFSILILSNNHLEGPFPAELLRLKNGEIYLDNNNFIGTLPEVLTFTDVTLKALHLQSNKFSGCIPQTWNQINSLCGNPECPGINLADNYFNCSQLNCMQYLPTGAPSFCPKQVFKCEPGKYCWNIPSTVVLIITLSCGGFVVGNLAMFFAAKYVDMGIYTRVSDQEEKRERKLIKKVGQD